MTEYDENGCLIVDMNITPIRLARKSREYIEEVFKRGYDINQCEKDDIFQFRFLNLVRNTDDIKLALKYGANPNIIDHDGYTPFQLILISHNLDAIRCCLHEGDVDIRIPIPEDGSVFAYVHRYINVWLRRSCNCDEIYNPPCFRCKGIKLYNDKLDMLYSHKNKTFSLFEIMLEKIDQFQ